MDGNAPASALLNEMVNSEQTHLAVFKLYYREPRTLYFVADAETGDIYDGGKSEEDAEKKKQAFQKLKHSHRGIDNSRERVEDFIRYDNLSAVTVEQSVTHRKSRKSPMSIFKPRKAKKFGDAADREQDSRSYQRFTFTLD
jgi:hypothetical protein